MFRRWRHSAHELDLLVVLETEIEDVTSCGSTDTFVSLLVVLHRGDGAVHLQSLEVNLVGIVSHQNVIVDVLIQSDRSLRSSKHYDTLV